MSGPNRFVRGKGGKTILGGKGPKFSQQINLATPAPRESLEQYWHPDRLGVEPAPDDFAQRLRDTDVELRCCRPPANAPIEGGAAWLMWYKRPRITHSLCPGWLLLFSWRNDAGVPQPLDERVFAVLYAVSARKWGSASNYFKRAIEEKMRDAKKARDRAFDNHRKAKQRELIRSRRITTAGTGSKFARHHDGTIVPTRGEVAWHMENRRRILPSEQIAAEDEAQERSRASLADMRTELRKSFGIG